MNLFYPVSRRPFPINQNFGQNANTYYAEGGLKGHTGLDVYCDFNESIYSACAGEVFAVRNKDNPDLMRYRAVYVLVEAQGRFYEVSYGHANLIFAKEGDFVEVGTPLMTGGNTGDVVGGGIKITKAMKDAGSTVGCYDKETEVLTQNGWKLFNDLQDGDTICTLNPKTKKIEYHTPNAKIKVFSEKIYKASNSNLDIAISYNHNITSYDKNLSKIYNTKLYTNEGGRLRIPLDGKYDGKEIPNVIIPSVQKIVKSGLYKKEFIIDTDEIKIKMDDWLDFLGWFLSDGSCSIIKQKNGQMRYLVNICQGYSNKKKIREITNCLDKLPFTYHINKGKKSHAQNFVIFNKQLATLLHQYGKGKDKVIPEYVKDLSNRQINIFLNSFFRGDGYTAPGSTKYFYPGLSEKMADQLQILLLHTGISSRKKIKKTKKGNKIYEIITRVARSSHLKRTDFKETDYNDYVYCVEVTNHIMRVRRNGYTYWCGNTHLHFQIREVIPVDKRAVGKKYLENSRGTFKRNGQFFEILNYDNGYAGGIDPMPFFNGLSAIDADKPKIEKPVAHKWNINLQYGQYHKDIEMAQRVFIAQGLMSPIPDNEFGWFGNKTVQAMQKYQTIKGINPTAPKYLGPRTRFFLNTEVML